MISQDINAFFAYNTMLVYEYQSKNNLHDDRKSGSVTDLKADNMDCMYKEN